MTHFVMLQRNLIYTGITRAKKICVLIGQTKALAYAIRNMAVLKRNMKLKERLNGTLTSQSKMYVLSLENMQMAAEGEIEYKKEN
jgi:helicase, recD/traA family